MRNTVAPLILTGFLLLLGARGAHAVWSETQITPKSLEHISRTFELKSGDREGLRQIEITVGAKTGQLSPFTRAVLSIPTDDGYAYVPVEETRRGAKVSYWFRLSPSLVPKAKFEVREQAYTTYGDAQGNPQRDAQGKPIVKQTLGGQAWWFCLRDFPELNAP